MNKRIVVVGAVQFSRRSVEALVRSGARVVGVITGNARALRRHSDACSLSPYAQEIGVPSYETDDINEPAVLDWIHSLAPDVILVIGWSQLLKAELLNLPALGCIGAHPTLLPEGRGRHPIIWTLLRGMRRGGLTFMLLDAGADSGDIVLQEPFEITDDDDAGSVYDKVCRTGEALMPVLAMEIESGLPHRRSQDESCATYYPKRTSRDGEIDWAAPAGDIRNLVRALAPPYPGAHTFVQRPEGLVRVVITRCTEVREATTGPRPLAGSISKTSDGALAVQTGQGTIVVQACEPPDLLRPGDVLCRETANALS